MQVADFLDELGYQDSPSFLGQRERALGTVPDYGHIFRLAKAKLSLCGVYTLRSRPDDPNAAATPVVYVCKAGSEEEADQLHRFVWNQDVVPFLIIHTPKGVKLYSGFRHELGKSGKVQGVLEPLTGFNNLSDLVAQFSAKSIDTGNLWRVRGSQVTPEYRVDWKLLKNLQTLDSVLQKDGLPRETTHALIGKYVYLHYLRDRDILSSKKLGRWGIDPKSVFGHQATIKGVSAVVDNLNNWLNGNVFPLSFRGPHAPKQDHLRYVAGVFHGDQVTTSGERQLSLDFQAYDFSFIPIETLSIVYEQFLHTPTPDGQKTHGRETGSYYTPIPIVNLMLAELEERRPLKRGMRVLDPSCGSGAFLVQCFRRLIETEFPPGTKPRPTELRELLEDHIFGVDVEKDACNVTELSLALTLLDYVDPPDLEDQRHRFKLPALRGKNIFDSNFFAEDAGWQPLFSKSKFDWIVGNPPWKRLNPSDLSEVDRPVWKWMKDHEKQCPVGGNQVARAFAWKAPDYLLENGEAALFLPAMTLFENPAEAFRREFFQRFQIHTVANFSNLAEVLSGGRFRVPAASFFYKYRQQDDLDINQSVRVYSPLVANQEPTRPEESGRRNESWSIVVNASEIRDIQLEQIASGNGLPWKLATWGSQLDSRLLNRLSKKFPTLGDIESSKQLILSEGLQLRRKGVGEDLERVDEVVGKNRLDVTQLEGLRHIFSFPTQAVILNDPDLKFARKGRAKLPLSVCKSPHIIVSAARTFAVYSDEYLIVPPRQIGIASPKDDEQFLRCLSLFLSADFAFYHQFMTSTQFGVQRGVATLSALRCIPIPLLELSKSDIKVWLQLHDHLLKTSPIILGQAEESKTQLTISRETSPKLQPLLGDLNALVSDALELDQYERALVSDFVHVRWELNDGKVGEPAVRKPSAKELAEYAKCLKRELDDFAGGRYSKRHYVQIVFDELSGMVATDFIKNLDLAKKVQVSPADDEQSKQLTRTRERLRIQRAQWVYFDRNLRIYEDTKTFIMKPMQRFHWTRTQAMLDAREIIAETLSPSELRG
jgi:hypothetical protein